MQIVIVFSCCKLTIVSCNILIVKTSSAAKHSSNSNTFGSLRSDKAITNFFFWPPDKNFAFMSFKLSSSNLEIK